MSLTLGWSTDMVFIHVGQTQYTIDSVVPRLFAVSLLLSLLTVKGIAVKFLARIFYLADRRYATFLTFTGARLFQHLVLVNFAIRVIHEVQ